MCTRCLEERWKGWFVDGWWRRAAEERGGFECLHAGCFRAGSAVIGLGQWRNSYLNFAALLELFWGFVLPPPL